MTIRARCFRRVIPLLMLLQGAGCGGSRYEPLTHAIVARFTSSPNAPSKWRPMQLRTRGKLLLKLQPGTCTSTAEDGAPSCPDAVELPEGTLGAIASVGGAPDQIVVEFTYDDRRTVKIAFESIDRWRYYPRVVDGAINLDGVATYEVITDTVYLEVLSSARSDHELSDRLAPATRAALASGASSSAAAGPTSSTRPAGSASAAPSASASSAVAPAVPPASASSPTSAPPPESTAGKRANPKGKPPGLQQAGGKPAQPKSP